jgi:ABC-2 type transport system ATP-binding protein
MTAIVVRNLTKSFQSYQRREGVWGSVKDLFHREYREVRAVDAINFTVEQGELLGYIGPNGAGKSTSIKMLTGILQPTSGEISVLGFHPFRDRKDYTQNIGVVFGQRTQLWWDIAVIESLKLLGSIYEVPKAELTARIEHLTEILDLKEVLHTPVRKLSLGQRMRCDLAASLVHQPPLLFLDEPTIGLDAVAKESIRTFLRTINRELRTTVILTIEELCQRIVILDKGRIIYDGALSRVKSLSGLEHTVQIDFSTHTPLAELEKLFQGRARLSAEGERRVIAAYNPEQLSTVELIREVISKHEIIDLALSEPDIEKVVMKIYRDGAP